VRHTRGRNAEPSARRGVALPRHRHETFEASACPRVGPLKRRSAVASASDILGVGLPRGPPAEASASDLLGVGLPTRRPVELSACRSVAATLPRRRNAEAFQDQHRSMVHFTIFIKSPFCFGPDHYNFQWDDGGVNKMATLVSKDIRWEDVPVFPIRSRESCCYQFGCPITRM
jgi:hypothetical protein